RLHFGDPFVAARVAEEDYVVPGKVRLGEIRIVFDPGMRPIVHGPEPVEASEYPQRMRIGRLVPRRSRRTHEQEGIEESVVYRSLKRVRLVQPRPFARLGQFPTCASFFQHYLGSASHLQDLAIYLDLTGFRRLPQ